MGSCGGLSVKEGAPSGRLVKELLLLKQSSLSLLFETVLCIYMYLLFMYIFIYVSLSGGVLGIDKGCWEIERNPK